MAKNSGGKLEGDISQVQPLREREDHVEKTQFPPHFTPGFTPAVPPAFLPYTFAGLHSYPSLMPVPTSCD